MLNHQINSGRTFAENKLSSSFSANRCVTMNQVRGIFGLGMEDYIGKIAFPAVQVSALLRSLAVRLFPALKE